MFERHSGAIGRTLRRQGLSAEAAEDATQQAFLIASERLDEIRPDRERAFLFGVVLRVTSSKRRRLARYQFEANMDVHPAPGSALDEANERVLALEMFNQVLERLDQDLIQAFVLFELQDLSKNEVARELGIPPGTAASRRRRARQTVEATLARLGQLEVSPVRLHRTPPRTRECNPECSPERSPGRAAPAAKAKGPIAKLPVAPRPGTPCPDTKAPDVQLPDTRLPGAGRVLAESVSTLPVPKLPVASASYGLRTERRMRLA
jgi:RNA polymerase sigma-70 factor (ECF subfamily)